MAVNFLEQWQAEEARASGAPDPMAVLPNTPKISVDLSQEEGLDRLEDELLKDAVGVLYAAGKWADVDPEKPNEVPADWPVTMTKKEVKRAMRIALAANKNAKDAPVGLTIAKNIALGILTARRKRTDGDEKALNIAVVQLPPVTAEYKVLEDKR